MSQNVCDDIVDCGKDPICLTSKRTWAKLSLFRRWALVQSSHKNSSQSVHNVVALACTSSLKHGSQNSSVIIYSINEKEIIKWNLKHDGCDKWSRKFFPFRSTWVHPLFLVGFMSSFMCIFCRSLFVLLVIVLSVRLRYTDSDYHIGIFKLFFVYVTSFKTLKG